MWSRISYTLRETWASFQRNVTLTVAAIITAAVSLLIFGLTLLIQQGFDNLLTQWEGGIEMIVFVDAGSSTDQRAYIEGLLDQQVGNFIEDYTYCDVECSLDEAQTMLAGEPTTLSMLNEENIPTSYKIRPTEEADVQILRAIKNEYLDEPQVNNVVLAEDQLDLITRMKGFVGTYTNALWISLLFAAGLLIWNTIRTAMFARRREIEVMKLVGATDWFIRIPFMLEGFIQGVLGGSVAVGLLHFINWRWTEGVKNFPDGSGMTALVVVSNYPWVVSAMILAFGALVGTISSGIAASRFLDV